MPGELLAAHSQKGEAWQGGGVMAMDETREPSRRDFLYLVTTMAGVVGVGAASWPFIDQMRPDASTLAMASIEVDVFSLVECMSLTVKWRGRPVFIRNRTRQEIEAARALHSMISRTPWRATRTSPMTNLRPIMPAQPERGRRIGSS